MAPEVQISIAVPCRDAQSRVVASVRIWNGRKAAGTNGDVTDLIRWSDAEAEAMGEEPVQLRERGRYLYKIEPNDAGLDLEESPAITRSPASSGEGFIEPGDQCGVLPLVLVRADDPAPVASGAVAQWRSGGAVGEAALSGALSGDAQSHRRKMRRPAAR